MMNRRRKRHEARESEFPAEWRQYLAAGWAAWHSLSRDERERLEGLVKVFVADKRWEAARGFALTDEMRVVIAAQTVRHRGRRREFYGFRKPLRR